MANKSWKAAFGDRGGRNENAMSEVEHTTKDIDAIGQTLEKAGKIVGVDEQKQELRDTRDALASKDAELRVEKEETLKDQIKELRGEIAKRGPQDTQLQHELRDTQDALQKERLANLEAKLTEVKEALVKGNDISSQIATIRTTAKSLGMSEGAIGSSSNDIALQLKKMEIESSLQIARMEDDRNRRDKEWELTLKKWEEEKAIRREEIATKANSDKEKVALIRDMGGRFGKAIVEGAMGGSGETETGGGIASKAPESFTVDAKMGEEGEIVCPNPKCKTIIEIATDTVTAVCANCGMRVPINRIREAVKK